AERDGDTVSPERGVYLVDLRRTVAKSAVVERLRANLKRETALKAAGTHAFASIGAGVRRVLSQVSAARIFRYEQALFELGSKHITKRANQRAAPSLSDPFASSGYAPEYQGVDAPPRGGINARPPIDAATAQAGTRTANVVATLRGAVNPEI